MVSPPHRTLLHMAKNDTVNSQFDGDMIVLSVLFLGLLILSLTFFIFYCLAQNSESRNPSRTDDGQPPSVAPPFSSALKEGKSTHSVIIAEVKYGSAETTHVGGTECSICLNDFVDGEMLKVWPICEHCFHVDCVEKWILSSSSCPLCRRALLKQGSDAVMAIPNDVNENLEVNVSSSQEHYLVPATNLVL